MVKTEETLTERFRKVMWIQIGELNTLKLRFDKRRAPVDELKLLKDSQDRAYELFDLANQLSKVARPEGRESAVDADVEVEEQFSEDDIEVAS